MKVIKDYRKTLLLVEDFTTLQDIVNEVKQEGVLYEFLIYSKDNPKWFGLRKGFNIKSFESEFRKLQD